MPLVNKLITYEFDVGHTLILRISNKVVTFILSEDLSKFFVMVVFLLLYLGIDIGKFNHVASLLDDQAKPIFKGFSFPNSTAGADSLLEMLSRYPMADISVGMEATGHYWLALYSYLIAQGFVIHVVNPLQTDGWRKGTEIRKRKTDKIDSVLIAELIRYGNFLETAIAQEDIFSLRTLTRFRQYLVESTGDLKRKAICVLDQTFPEYQTVFSDIFGQTSKELLLHFQTPEDFQNITSDQLSTALENIRQKRFAQKKVDEISQLASHSFGISFAKDSFALQLKMLLEQISFIDTQINELEHEVAHILAKLNSVITTIPGIDTINGAVILSEIGDIKRFSTPAKLVAYAGIDASVSQSGEYVGTNNKMSKRGSPYLRKALFQAALVAAFHDPVFSAYYRKKIAEGKHHLTALGAVARKLCYTIHALLKNDEPYKPQLNTIHPSE